VNEQVEASGNKCIAAGLNASAKGSGNTRIRIDKTDVRILNAIEYIFIGSRSLVVHHHYPGEIMTGLAHHGG